MDVTRDHLDQVGLLYGQWLAMPFPARLYDVDPDGVDLVLLDADLASCIQSWLANRGELDVTGWNWLFQCVADLDRVLPLLPGGEGTAYFTALRRVAVQVCTSTRLPSGSRPGP